MMIEKIKNHFLNLNVTQKILYLVLVFWSVSGEGPLIKVGFGYYSEEVRLGIMSVCLVGILLFGDKKVK